MAVSNLSYSISVEKIIETPKTAHHNANFNMDYNDIKNGVKVNLGQHSKGLATINIPYRAGMCVYIDGRQVNIHKVNYMMTGVPVNKNDQTIIIKYQPLIGKQ